MTLESSRGTDPSPTTRTPVPSKKLEKDVTDLLDILEQGGVGIVPLDVAYAVNAMTERGIRTIFDAKRRSYEKPSGLFANATMSREIHQMDEEEDPKFAGAVRRCCRAGKKLPTLTFAPESARDSRLMKKVRSFGSFDDLRVPDIDGYSNEETGSYNSDSDSFSGGGYVQDVSPFDRILLAAWEDRFAAGLFRYDVTACKTKVVPGGYGFVAQFNEGRATKKRPSSKSILRATDLAGSLCGMS